MIEVEVCCTTLDEALAAARAGADSAAQPRADMRPPASPDDAADAAGAAGTMRIPR